MLKCWVSVCWVLVFILVSCMCGFSFFVVVVNIGVKLMYGLYYVV